MDIARREKGKTPLESRVLDVFRFLWRFLRNKNGGEGEIRTHGTASRSVDFESTAFDHSATSPLIPTFLL